MDENLTKIKNLCTDNWQSLESIVIGIGLTYHEDYKHQLEKYFSHELEFTEEDDYGDPNYMVRKKKITPHSKTINISVKKNDGTIIGEVSGGHSSFKDERTTIKAPNPNKINPIIKNIGWLIMVIGSIVTIYAVCFKK